MEFYEALEKSSSLAELHDLCELPEPYDDRGYFFVYYAEADYKSALSDVVRFIGDGMRVYYDRRLEHGASWQKDYLLKCRTLHCRCVVIYLSEHCFGDDTFEKLCKTIYENNIPYVSINLGGKYGIQSGEQMIERMDGISPKTAEIYKKLFANEITYIPYTFSTDEKCASLRKAHSKPAFSFSVNGDHAVVDCVRDVTEEELVIPRSVILGDTEYIVREIAPAAFAGCRDLRKITFPETIEVVGVPTEGAIGNMFARAFDNCACLTELVFPPTLKRFGAGNLTGCASLKRLILGDDTEFVADAMSVATLFYTGNAALGADEEADGDGTFTEIKLPSCVKRTADGDFLACIGGTWSCLDVPEAETLYGYTEWKIEKDVYIDRDTDPSYLCGTENIQSVVFDPEWRIGNLYACFAGCTNLERVTLPKRCYTMSGTFYGCARLETIELPQTLVRIEDETFCGCAALTEIVLPRAVTYVAHNAFAGCDRLHTLVVENPDAKKILRGGIHPSRQKGKTFAAKLALFFHKCKDVFVILRHLPTYMRMRRLPPFYRDTAVCDIYTRCKVKIKGFRPCESDRTGYFKYVRV